MKERTDLINKELQTNDYYNWYDIVDCIEMASMINNRPNSIKKLSEIMEECADDYINSWGIFIKYCYDKYRFGTDDCIEKFINYELDNCVEEFIHRFYTRDRQEIRKMIEDGALDCAKEFNEMSKELQEQIIDYWVENYDKE